MGYGRLRHTQYGAYIAHTELAALQGEYYLRSGGVTEYLEEIRHPQEKFTVGHIEAQFFYGVLVYIAHVAAAFALVAMVMIMIMITFRTLLTFLHFFTLLFISLVEQSFNCSYYIPRNKVCQ